jgi:DNA-directed RNA polymerase sigma subunit (sigma70/sigma32)
MQETNQQTGALTGAPAERLIDPQSTATPTPGLPELVARQTLDTSYIPTKAGPAEDDILGIYVKEAKQFPLLTREEEVHLAKTYQAGRLAQARLSDDNQLLTDSQRLSLEQQFEAGQTAKEAFIKSNLRLVISLAKKI